MIIENDEFILNKDMVLREISGERIVISIRDKRVFSFNDLGFSILKKLESFYDFDSLLSFYSIEKSDIEKSVAIKKYIAELVKLGIIFKRNRDE